MLEAILADGEFTPRAITRNIDSEAAKAISSRGVEVVQADLSDIDSLRKAFTGCEGVFSVGFIANDYRLHSDHDRRLPPRAFRWTPKSNRERMLLMPPKKLGSSSLCGGFVHQFFWEEQRLMHM